MRTPGLCSVHVLLRFEDFKTKSVLRTPSVHFFDFFFFYLETGHWINHGDYEGPPCSAGIIKKGILVETFAVILPVSVC